MPSPGEDIYSWSTVAADNGTADPLINWQEGQVRASVNNSSRSEMAAHAKNRNLLNGSIVTTGSSDVQAFLSGQNYTTIPTGLTVRLKIGAGLTNPGSMTLNMDGIGSIVVKFANGSDLKGGEVRAGYYADFLYNGTNWIYLGLDVTEFGIAPVEDPVFEGDPQAPTPPPNDNDQSIATTEWVQQLISGGDGIVLAYQVFSTPGNFTYTPHAQMKSCLIECVGGGGGGGGVVVNAAFVLGGGGGGAGGYSRKLCMKSDIGVSQPVVVGANGIGVFAGAGTAGTDSSVGTFCLARGGGGGGVCTPSQSGAGGVGATAGTGNVAATGAAGHNGLYWNGAPAGFGPPAGIGGNSYFGGGGKPGQGTSTGAVANGGNAAGFGAGGGGASSNNQAASNGSGGNGSSGLVIITEFAGVGIPGAPGAPGATGATGPAGPAGPAGSGSGDVLVSGTPVAGQVAQWVDASHITGVTPGTNAFTTGDAKLTLKTTADAGWVMMDDGTIGDATSGATTRANADCQALFTLLWTNVTNTWAAVSGGRGASAAADWGAHKTIGLTKQLGRALGIAGTGAGLSGRALGANVGEENHLLAAGEMPAHNHTLNATNYLITASGANLGLAAGGDASTYQATSYTSTSVTAFAGGSTAHNTMQPTTFWNIMIKL